MFGFWQIFLALVLGLGLAFLLSEILMKRKYPPKLPNGTMGWPFIGETLNLLKPHISTSIGSFMREHCSRYGKVFRSHLFGSPTIVSCDHDLNMFILQNEDKLFQADYPKVMHDILGNFSLLILSSDSHKKQRNVVVNFVSSCKSSINFCNLAEKLAVSVLESWKDCREVSFFREMKKFTLKLILKSLMGFEPERPLTLEMLEDFETYMRGFVSLPLDIPGSAYRKAVKARARLSSNVRKIVNERLNGSPHHDGKGDFLDEILSNWRLSFQEIASVILDILLGGYETTSILVSLIVYFLGHNPGALEKLKEEHESIREGKEKGKLLSWEDYQKMDYTRNVILEGLRLGNVVKFLHRKALQDIKHKEYTIPAGWKVLPVLAGVHLDPVLHENPSEFNPSRWSTDKATSKKLMSFGGGPRLCPGAELAKVETALFLHHFVLSYRWKVRADDCPIAYPFVEFKRGLVLEIEPIQAAEGKVD
ncbi:hypothetical protein K2173_013946 [Erythroxylum novogranatense]|uniref:Cytochrome P450 724B1 n=1 Tax=Erythroxylum novogranatense TaxID=1862640 RepID=A0AAV8SDC5_9ROSI|nr:hypothetical protein K2173_013946 [Erythroxylum novogranatense]